MLYSIVIKKPIKDNLSNEEKFAVKYHSLFNYPLSFSELITWKSNINRDQDLNIVKKNGYYCLEGQEGVVYQRLLKKRISEKKLLIAKKAAKLLSIIPTIKMLAITGSLAMNNAGDQSDIDLMVITKAQTLWLTRLISYLLLLSFNIAFRKAMSTKEKDKLCLNIWLDENDILWKKDQRNIYTAHEVAQIKVMINKDHTYEKFLWTNRWLLKYWPNAIKIRKQKFMVRNISAKNTALQLFNSVAFKIQYHYMKSKISRETVTLSRALFHPQDWSKVVLSRLSS